MLLDLRCLVVAVLGSVQAAELEVETCVTASPFPSYHTVILGGGAAGLGPLYNAAMQGELESFLEKGVLILEQSERLGSGNFHSYVIESNSAGAAFVDILQQPNVSKLFPRTLKSPLVPVLNVSIPVPLSIVGAFLEEMAQELKDIMEGYPSCRVVLEASAQEVAVSNGSTRITYEDVETGVVRQVLGEHVIITMGGVQDMSTCRNDKLGRTGLSLQQCGFQSLVSAERFIKGAFKLHRPEQPTVVVGSSHSAWSMLVEVAKRRGAQNWTDVTVIERNPRRYFFYSEEEAKTKAVAFDSKTDVCPITGRVHRFRGIRWSARDLALGVDELSWLKVVRDVEDTKALCDVIAKANIICASGYRPRMPLLRVDGKEAKTLFPSNTAQGYLVTDHGAIENVFVYGLGAGLQLGSWIGGELIAWGDSRAAQADGVWLYQFDVGGLIYNQLMHRVAPTLRRDGWLRIYNEKAKRLDLADAPLHHFGGYEMFTWEQWEQQVGVLAAPFPKAEKGFKMLEVGVGAGAFASVVQSLRPGLTLTGVDTAAAAINVARKRLEGDFFVAGAEDIPSAFQEKSFDFAACFGLFTYLESEEVAEQLMRDMLRLARKFVYVGEVSDLAKKDKADALRKQSHVNQTAKQQHVSSTTPSHLYVSKDMFQRVADAAGARLEFRNHDEIGLTYPTAVYRFSAYFFLP